MAQGSPAEMVGATERPIMLQSDATTTASVSLSTPTGPARLAFAAGSRRVYLNVENIKSQGVAPSYAIYLNLPEGADPDQHEDLLVGLLPSFGVHEATRKTAHYSGSGLRHAWDVTAIVERLERGGHWDPSTAKITFVPVDPATKSHPVSIGRASFYYK
jgi:tyrosinase